MAAATEAGTARHAAVDRHQTELTRVEKEITRTGTAIDRYLTAFENSTLDPALLPDRLSALRAKTAQLQARRDELTELLDQVPAMPSDNELGTLADHIDQILDHGTPAQRKALIKQLVEEIQIVGPSRIRPIYRIPRRSQEAEPAADDGTTVRTMDNLVGLPGARPRPSPLECRRCKGSRPAWKKSGGSGPADGLGTSTGSVGGGVVEKNVSAWR